MGEFEDTKKSFRNISKSKVWLAGNGTWRGNFSKLVSIKDLALITNKLTGILTQLDISGLTYKTEALYLMKMAKQDSNK